jgi:hypothetical protein
LGWSSGGDVFRPQQSTGACLLGGLLFGLRNRLRSSVSSLLAGARHHGDVPSCLVGWCGGWASSSSSTSRRRRRRRRRALPLRQQSQREGYAFFAQKYFFGKCTLCFLRPECVRAARCGGGSLLSRRLAWWCSCSTAFGFEAWILFPQPSRVQLCSSGGWSA